MRLHALSITAFGPFAETVEVDFDTLSEAGLFLLCGATGAGKSSVLDAVCFALYGEVPGDRSSAKRLRCDVAAPGAAPRVFLDVSLGERRFHLTRTPSWQRPKKRGTGTTLQQASVLVEELVDGRPQHLTHRLDEAGHLISGLLGMNLSQFTQVAMLPQGRFQDFLRARSEDRHTLLQKLFRTHRFEDMERWLREHRIGLRRESEEHGERIAGLVHRLDEVSGVAFAEEIDHAVVAAGAADESLGRWAQSLADSATESVRSRRERLQQGAEDAEAASEALLIARSLAEQQGRHAQALATLADLEAQQGTVETSRHRISEARRAAPVAAVADQAARARLHLSQAASVAEQAGRSLPALPEHELDGPVGLDNAEAALEAARDRLASARALRPVATEVRTLRASLEVSAGAQAALRSRHEQLSERVAALPAEVAAVATEVERARAAGPALLEARQRAEALEARLTAMARVGELAGQLQSARDLHREAVDAHQLAREAWLGVHEQRLNGMAAEIALDLAVGASCPVCGSCDHPHLASPSPGAPAAAEEKAARKQVDDTDVVRQAHDERVRDVETLLAVAREQAGANEAADLVLALGSACADVDELAETVAGLEPARTRHQDAEAALAQARAALAVTEAEQAAATEEVQRTQERLGRLEAALTETLGDLPLAASGDQLELEAVIALREQVVGVLGEACAARRALEQAELRLREVEADVERAAHDCGFEDAQAAVAALLPVASLSELEAQVTEYDEVSAAARGFRDDPELIAAAASPVPDLTVLEGAHQAAARALSDAETAHHAAVETAGRIEALRTQLLDGLAAWGPVRAAFDLAASVSAFAEGKAPDNRAQMRLSGYVLSWRLGQVVAAANLRLAGMTDQRYALEHTAVRGAGETRGGLSLVMRDAWSGEARDPVTLSGGETFVVSLALALGLTDVVTQEAGGADIGTLFVDEGFGSLDADTLDDVMNTLDGLRDGGRVVGIVSHVPELRTRIPAQLQVDKVRGGSRVRLVHEPA